jgi:peptidoglycan hydrolase FlgJ
MADLPLTLQAAGAADGLASDSRALDKLRLTASTDPAKAVKQVATQFEALFMQMVLKSMRDASPKSGMLDSSDQQMYTSMLDEQLAQKIASGGTGLADVIARQLSRNLPSSAADGTAGAVPSAATEGKPSVAASAAKEGSPLQGSSPASPSHLLETLRAAAAVRKTQ